MENANPLLRDGPGVLESMWQYRWLVVAGAIIGGVAVYFLADAQPRVYEAQATMFLGVPGEDTISQRNANTDENQRIGQLAARLRTDKVYTEAAERAGLDVSASELRDRLTVIGTPENATITVLATGGEPQVASGLANEVVQTHLEEVERLNTVEEERVREQFEEQISALNEQIAAIEDLLREIPDDAAAPVELQSLLNQRAGLENDRNSYLLDAAAFGEGVREVEFADPPGSAVAPQPRRMAAVGVIVGAALGAALAFWLAGRGSKVESERQVVDLLDAPLLGTLRVLPSADRAVDDADDEAYRFVLSSIEAVLARRGGSSVLVTTALPTAGKTEFSLWLSVAAARDGRRVVLVDGDVRDHWLSRVVSSHFRRGKVKLDGLTDIASNRRSVEEAVFNYPVTSNQTFLSIVTAGRARDDSNTFVRSPGFRDAMHDIREHAELTIVDAAPLLTVADTSAIGGHVDGMVVLVERGAPVREIEQLRNRLQFVAAPLLGYVFVQESRLGEDDDRDERAPRSRRFARSDRSDGETDGQDQRPAALLSGSGGG